MAKPLPMFEKLWDAHVVKDLPDGRTLIHIDRHLVHERSSPQAFEGLRLAGRKVRSPEKTVAMVDHVISTAPGRGDLTVKGGDAMIHALRTNAGQYGIRMLDVDDPQQGIVHVVAPELGLVRPGMTVVCGDSHTCTLGALGAWAWGIGTSEIEHVLATQTLAMRKPRAKRLRIQGRLATGLDAKDLALWLTSKLGVGGLKAGFVELDGEAVRQLDMESRLTICNMGIEAGARSLVIAPDEVTIDYLRKHCAQSQDFSKAAAAWRLLGSDPGATYDEELRLEVDLRHPQVTWGTLPEHAIDITGRVPRLSDAASASERDMWSRALDYMGLKEGSAIEGLAVDHVFIGSCTNGRISDLIAAASVVDGQKVAAQVRALVVPGSTTVMREAEKLGLRDVFEQAGFEWRMPGCSMCVGMNEDQVPAGKRCVSTSNRNFEGRQGPGARTHLASPASAAAAAIAGRLVDFRELGDPR